MTSVFAHRGWSTKAPENTMAAFTAAAELGVDGIELDVQMTKDGQLVVIHDEQVGRTTNGTGWVKDLSLAELQTLDAGSWFGDAFRGASVPLLREVLELLRPYHRQLNIELKNGLVRYPGLEELVLQQISDYSYPIIISSFNHQSLHRLHQLDSQRELGILYFEVLHRPWDYARALGATALHPYYLAVDQTLFTECQSAGISVRPWTVDDWAAQQQLLALGAAGIITNRPEQLISR